MAGVFFIVYPIAAMLLGIVFIVITAKLSGKDSSVPGAAAIAVAVVFFLCLNLAAVHQYGGAEITRLTAPMENGKTAEMYVRIDGENRIVAYGPLEIKDADGTVCDSEEIYNYEEELKFSAWGDMFKVLTKGRTVEARNPSKKSIVTDAKMLIAEGENGVTYVVNAFGLYVMPLVETGVPLLAVYLLQRRRVNRRKRAEELRRMEIQSL